MLTKLIIMGFELDHFIDVQYCRVQQLRERLDRAKRIRLINQEIFPFYVNCIKKSLQYNSVYILLIGIIIVAFRAKKIVKRTNTYEQEKRRGAPHNLIIEYFYKSNKVHKMTKSEWMGIAPSGLIHFFAMSLLVFYF
jgi:hypothetical protein